MSAEFKEFSEAARLYAQYEAVVDEMEEAFQSSLAAFCEAAKDRIAELPGGEAIAVYLSGRYVNWWLQDPEIDPEGEVAFVWFDSRDAKIIHPGVLTLTVELEGATDSERPQLLTLKDALKLPANCRVEQKGKWLRVEVKYGQEGPVANVAEAALAVLKPLYELNKKIFAVRQAELARSKTKN